LEGLQSCAQGVLTRPVVTGHGGQIGRILRQFLQHLIHCSSELNGNVATTGCRVETDRLVEGLCRRRFASGLDVRPLPFWVVSQFDDANSRACVARQIHSVLCAIYGANPAVPADTACHRPQRTHGNRLIANDS
jgi:hypothetical protein